MLLPNVKSMPGFIYEFKFTRDEKTDLEALAQEALTQINDKKYDTELLSAGIKNIPQPCE